MFPVVFVAGAAQLCVGHMNNPINFHIVIWSLIVLCAGTLSLFSGVPTILSPHALLSVIPALIVSSTPLNYPELPYRTFILSLLAAGPIMIAYIAWSLPCRTSPKIPMHSILIWLIVCILSILTFTLSWDNSIKWRGEMFTIVLAILNVFIAALCGLFIIANRKQPSPTSVIVFHGIMFTWLAWGAFPWLGESF
jgi:hypothetical protein